MCNPTKILRESPLVVTIYALLSLIFQNFQNYIHWSPAGLHNRTSSKSLCLHQNFKDTDSFWQLAKKFGILRWLICFFLWAREFLLQSFPLKFLILLDIHLQNKQDRAMNQKENLFCKWNTFLRRARNWSRHQHTNTDFRQLDTQTN